jgi:integrase
MAKTLTDIAIRNLKPGSTRREIADAGCRGLYLVLQPSGVKSFAVRYRYGGKSRKLTLKSGISLLAARKAAADAFYQVDQGHDPSVARRQAKQAQRLAAADTLRAVCEEYQHREGHKLRTARWRSSALARLVYPTLGDRPIGEIRRSEIVRLLDKIEEDSGPVMADRSLAIIRSLMNWHAARSDDFRSPIVRGMARTNTGQRARQRVLTDVELRAVWQAAGKTAAPFGALVQFLLLTAARRGEAARMTWDEISGIDWTLPASRNKAKIDLVRPLSAAARDVIARLPRFAGCAFVFTGDGRRPFNSFSRAKPPLAAASGVANWRLHDLRRTARSLMSRAGVNTDHAERCLGHVIGGVRGTYDRHEYHREKKQAFDALAALIDYIVNPTPNVVSIVAAPRG